MPDNDTATRLLDTAQALIQSRGYNAFSYSDLAKSVGIRTASIHYHFPAKADLGVALVERYTASLVQSLEAIDGSARTAKSKLRRFIELYRETECSGAMCLCGSLASDIGTLAEPLQDSVRGYLDTSRRWLQQTIQAGIRAGEFETTGKPADLAAALLAGLQGGLMLARAQGDGASLESVQRLFFQQLQ